MGILLHVADVGLDEPLDGRGPGPDYSSGLNKISCSLTDLKDLMVGSLVTIESNYVNQTPDSYE